MAQAKLTKKYLLKIQNDDITIRSTIKSTLIQAQEYLSLKENEIANNDPFDAKIRTFESVLSNLRIATEEIGAASISKELIFRIAKVDSNAIDRILEFNVKLLAIANEINSQAKSDIDTVIIKEKTNELRNTFSDRQKIFNTSKMTYKFW